MFQLSKTERMVVDELLECLVTAFDRTDADPAYATKTKLQKLLYLAVDEFDLPLTHSWYLAGAIVPGESVSPNRVQTEFAELPSTEQPTMPSDASSADTRDAATPADGAVEDSVSDVETEETVADFKDELHPKDDTEVDPVLFSPAAESATPETDPQDTAPQGVLGGRRDDIIDFYEQKLPNVWHQNTMQFLQNFYLSHAPEEYRELYLQSTRLRTRLKEVEEVITCHLDSEPPEQDLVALSKAVGLEVSDLHYSIRSSDSLSATLTDVVAGTDLIEDGIMMLSQLDPDDLTETHRNVVAEMQEFFYYWVWRLPCLIISQETVTGPSAETLRAQRQEQLASFDERLRQKCLEFERTLERADLKPAYTDYEIPDNETSQAAAELTKKYLE